MTEDRLPRVPQLHRTETTLGSLPWIKLMGDRRSIFTFLGTRFREEIRVLLASEQRRVAYVSNTPDYAKVVEASYQYYPPAFIELESMAEGALVSVDDLISVNLRGDFGFGGEGCSDFALARSDALFMVHNEDGPPLHDGACALLSLSIDGELAFSTYWYPGMLVGMTFWLNSAGIACGIDHIPVSRPGVGVGRQFLARKLAGSSSLDELQAEATQASAAGGYAYTVVAEEEKAAYDIEIGPKGSIIRKIAGRHEHTNHFLHLDDPQKIDQQSVPRLEAIRSIPQSHDMSEVFRLFAESSGTICRHAAGADPLMTLCTVGFDVPSRTVILQPRNHIAHNMGFDDFLAV